MSEKWAKMSVLSKNDRKMGKNERKMGNFLMIDTQLIT